MKCVLIFVFYGDKRIYESWKVVFLVCIDKVLVILEYKFLQLRQYFFGEVLKVVENFGYFVIVYEVVKDCFEWKFGG